MQPSLTFETTFVLITLQQNSNAWFLQCTNKYLHHIPLLFRQSYYFSHINARFDYGKMPNGVVNPVSLSIGVIAESGDRKTSVLKLLMKPILELDGKIKEKFKREEEIHIEKMSVLKFKCNLLSKNCARQ